MKSKIVYTIATVALIQVVFSQEVKKEILDEKKIISKDSIQPVLIEKPNTKGSAKASKPDAATIEATLAEQKAKKEAEKLLREEQKAKRELEERQKEVIKNQKKLEKQQDRIEKEQKEQIKKQKSISDAEEDIDKANDKLKDAQKDLIKDTEKHTKKLEKGKLSPDDIEKYGKDKLKQEKKIEDLKAKILKAETKLRKAKK
jgi:peptidoglycan hydrolase CwlO-like protein